MDSVVIRNIFGNNVMYVSQDGDGNLYFNLNGNVHKDYSGPELSKQEAIELALTILENRNGNKTV